MRGSAKNVNLLAAYNYKPKNWFKLKRFGYLAALVILLLAMLGGYLGLSHSTAKINAEIATLQEYTQDEENVEAFNDVNSLQVEMQTRQAMLSNAKFLEMQIGLVPSLYVEDFNQIQKSGPQINFDTFSFDAEKGALVISGKVVDYNAIPKFIIALKEREVFSDLEYYGYALGDEDKEKDKQIEIDFRYGFKATCYVKAVKSND